MVSPCAHARATISVIAEGAMARNCLSAMGRGHGVGACEAILPRGQMRQRRRRRRRGHGEGRCVSSVPRSPSSRTAAPPRRVPSRSPECQGSSHRSISLPLQQHSRSCQCAARPCLPPLPPTASPMRCRSRTPRAAWARPSGIVEGARGRWDVAAAAIVCDCVTHQMRPESDPRAMGATSVAHRRRRTRADRGTRPRDASEGWGGEEPARGVRAPSSSGGRSRRRPSPFHAVQSVRFKYGSTGTGRNAAFLVLQCHAQRVAPCSAYVAPCSAYVLLC